MTNPKLKKIIKVTLIAIAVVPLGLIVVWVAFYFYLTKVNQISPAEIQEKCQAYYQNVESQINAVPGYKVIKGTKDCTPIKDEAAMTDYNLSLRYRVSKAGIDSVETTTGNLKDLADKLPRKDYAVWVDNIAGTDGRSTDICVSTSRYIDNDGKDYPQGPPEHYPRYTEPGSNKDLNPCEGL